MEKKKQVRQWAFLSKILDHTFPPFFSPFWRDQVLVSPKKKQPGSIIFFSPSPFNQTLTPEYTKIQQTQFNVSSAQKLSLKIKRTIHYFKRFFYFLLLVKKSKHSLISVS